MAKKRAASKRNYKKEYQDFHGKEEQIKNRAARNMARRRAEAEGKVTKGDDKEVDHIKPLSKGGNNNKANTRVISKSENRRKAANASPKKKAIKKKTPKR